jgi:hypothetical protein
MTTMRQLIERVEEKFGGQSARGHDLEVGDILYSSWGYDQTNVNFYKVMDVRGKSTVIIQEVALKILKPGRGVDKVVPVPDRIIGDKLRKRVNPQGRVKIHSFEYAQKWDGEPKSQTSAGYGH